MFKNNFHDFLNPTDSVSNNFLMVKSIQQPSQLFPYKDFAVYSESSFDFRNVHTKYTKIKYADKMKKCIKNINLISYNVCIERIN